MSNEQTTAALDAASTKTTSTTTRRDRWRRHIVARLAEIENRDAYTPAAWLEEIEGRPMADIITDWLANHNGLGVENPGPIQKMRLADDEHYETEETARCRDNHERGDVRQAVYSLMSKDHSLGLDNEEYHAFLRLFYQAGDCGTHEAVSRAIKYALANA